MKKIIAFICIAFIIGCSKSDTPNPVISSSPPAKPFDSVRNLEYGLNVSAGGNCPNCPVGGFYIVHGITKSFYGLFGIERSGVENSAYDTVSFLSGDTVTFGIILSTLDKPYTGEQLQLNDDIVNSAYPYTYTFIVPYARK